MKQFTLTLTKVIRFLELLFSNINLNCLTCDKQEKKNARPHSATRDDEDDSSSRVNKHFDRPLMADFSIDHKSCPLHVSIWDMDQTKNSKYTSNTIFLSEMVSVI